MTDFDEVMKFVVLIEEHQDILLKSQKTAQKQKKAEAVDKIIPKWTEISGKTLTQVSLFKKISNLKSRAKDAMKLERPLNAWQTKLLELAGTTDIEADENRNSTPSLTLLANHDGRSSKNSTSLKSDAEQLLDKYETDETKLLTDAELQRLVLLKQVKVLTLQEKQLERLDTLSHIENGKEVTYEFVHLAGNQI